MALLVPSPGTGLATELEAGKRLSRAEPLAQACRQGMLLSLTQQARALEGSARAVFQP